MRGESRGLVVFNYGLHQSRRISVEAPGLRSNPNVKLWRMVSSGPGSSNEDAAQVTVSEEKLTGAELDLAPCSMAVLEWTDSLRDC
jgi:hypothetical protein